MQRMEIGDGRERKKGARGVRWLRWGLGLIWSVLIVVWTLRFETPVDTKAKEAAETAFSAERASAYVERLARMPHPMGSAENAWVRKELIAELTRLGMKTEELPYKGFLETRFYRGYAELTNVRAVLPGTDGAGRKALMLSAHYDSVEAGPGANDDMASVAALLETARALQAGEPLRNDVWIVLTDGEEMGCIGMEAFLKQVDVPGQVGLAINFEARGSKGPSMMYQTGPSNLEWLRVYAGAAHRPVANSFMSDLYRRMPNDTDLTPLLKRGLPGLNFAYIGGWETYHSPADDAAHVHRNTLQHQGDNALAMARSFGSRDLQELNGNRDAVYFNLFGRLVLYSNVWSIPLAVGLAAAGILLTVWEWRRRTVSMGRVAAFALLPFLSGILSATVASAVWRLIEQQWGNRITEWNGVILHRVWFDIGFLLLACVMGGLVNRIIPDRWRSAAASRAGGYWSAMLLLGLLMVFLPGAGYLAALPLVLYAAAWACSLRWGRRGWISWLPLEFMAVSVLPLALWTSVFHLLFEGVPPFENAVIGPIVTALILAQLAPSARGEAWSTGVPVRRAPEGHPSIPT